MKFPRSFLLAITCLTSISLTGQIQAHQEIQKRLDTYIDLTNRKDYSAAFDIMYPKMFSVVNKQDLIDMMNSATMDGLSFALSNRNVSSYSSPFKEGNETFVRIEYSADMAIKITEKGMYDSDIAAQAMLEGFKQTYGASSVNYDPTTKIYTINASKSMMAIQEEGKDWYLIEINPDQMDLMKSLFSESVISKMVTTKE